MSPVGVEGAVVISEVAWMGTTESANDEWIELYNNSETPHDVGDWSFKDEADNEVMITDIAGNLIHKGKANGGTFSWNLGNYSGFRAKSGVYLVFSINTDGTETYQTKFAILP
jgi:hypothetical protein